MSPKTPERPKREGQPSGKGSRSIDLFPDMFCNRPKRNSSGVFVCGKLLDKDRTTVWSPTITEWLHLCPQCRKELAIQRGLKM